MAKKSVKDTIKATKKVAKKSVAKKPKSSAPVSIEKVNEDILSKLQTLNAEEGLQSEIKWCLGSYRYDHNPEGLYAMAEKALPILKGAKSTTKLLADIQKALKART